MLEMIQYRRMSQIRLQAIRKRFAQERGKSTLLNLIAWFGLKQRVAITVALDHLSLTDQVSLSSLQIFTQSSFDAGYLRGVTPADLKLDGFLGASYLAEAKKK